MGGKKGSENSKKAAGQARKADTAAAKAAAEDAKKAAAADDKWQKGAKNTAKKYATIFCVFCLLDCPRCLLLNVRACL